jgi:hypothetical protein
MHSRTSRRPKQHKSARESHHHVDKQSRIARLHICHIMPATNKSHLWSLPMNGYQWFYF